MTTDKKKQKEFSFFQLVNPYAGRGEGGYLTSNVDAGFADAPFSADGINYDGEKVSVHLPIPRGADMAELEAELKKFYGDDMTVAEAMAVFTRTMSTRPNWKAIVLEHVNKDGWDKERAYRDLQEDVIANLNVKRSAGVTGTNVKAMAKKANHLEAETGLTMDQAIAVFSLTKQGKSYVEACAELGIVIE